MRTLIFIILFLHYRNTHSNIPLYRFFAMETFHLPFHDFILSFFQYSNASTASIIVQDDEFLRLRFLHRTIAPEPYTVEIDTRLKGGTAVGDKIPFYGIGVARRHSGLLMLPENTPGCVENLNLNVYIRPDVVVGYDERRIRRGRIVRAADALDIGGKPLYHLESEGGLRRIVENVPYAELQLMDASESSGME